MLEKPGQLKAHFTLINEQQYWDDIYASNCIERSPSSFADYTLNHYLGESGALLELGCGNGRDALYFAEHGLNVTGLDLSATAINSLSALKVHNAQFIRQDFAELSGFAEFDYVYSRFTLHSIDEATEKTVFEQIPRVLTPRGLFLAEARSLKDEALEKVFGQDHFRRYLDVGSTVDKLEQLGFTILEKTESRGLSPYKTEDPCLMRIVAQLS